MNIYTFTEVFKAREVTLNDKTISHICESYFSNESQQLYEHIWLHIVIYTSFDKKVYYVESDFLTSFVFLEESKITFFSPLIHDQVGFNDAVEALSQEDAIEIVIQSVSSEWIDTYTTHADFPDYLKKARSLNEVIYSTELLTDLAGKEFSKLRSVKNKILGSSMYLVKRLDNDTLLDALKVLEVWQRVQGIKYDRNKYEREKFVLESIAGLQENDGTINAYVVYFDQRPMGYFVYCKSPVHLGVGIIYLLKGLNRSEDGGVHGITDATYLYIFSEMRKNGISLANDGDLGSEFGTARHKLRFKPVDRYAYYDLYLL